MLEGIENIKSARVDQITNKDQNSFNVDVRVVYKDSNREYRKKFLIIMIKRKNLGWKIDPQTLLSLIEKEVWDELRQYSDKLIDEDLEFDESN